MVAIWCPLLVQLTAAVLLAWIGLVGGRITNQEIVIINRAQAVQGNTAALPCDLTPPLSGDKVHIVVWYKEGSDSPIYSFDSRHITALEHGNHWNDQSLGSRAFFKHAENPARLTLESVKESDAGLYRCRVDFAKSPTRNSKVNLTVIIPPEQLSILNEDGDNHIPSFVLGPYSEGASLNITCVAAGGRPQPNVTWWRENALLDNSCEVFETKKVRNVLYIPKLDRGHLRAVLTCQASNNNMVAPISSSLSLDMNLRPLWVRLKGTNRPFSAGATYEISCEVVGAKPTPTIEWTKGGVALQNVRQTTSSDANTTTSVLTFVPSIEDEGKILTCRGSVPVIADSEMEDAWKLSINHKPVISLEFGSNLNASAIREGLDVYFECNIKSHPWVYKVSWKHNGYPLYHNVATGTIISNQSLVLQNVSRNRAGIYTCVGSNSEGDGESNHLNLDIKFPPVCRPGQTKVFGVARLETVKIPCEVEANPREVDFTWRFNNSMEMVEVAVDLVTSDQTKSYVSYTPVSEMDYGTLLCWGTNDQGMQTDACIFHVVPVGRPDSPHNCTVKNTSSATLRVDCLESFDGGLMQDFNLLVELEADVSGVGASHDSADHDEAMAKTLNANQGLVIRNMTSRSASFVVSELEPTTTYKLTIYSSNAKGRSDSVVMSATTTAEMKDKKTGEKQIRPSFPENCTIVDESQTTVRVSCSPSESVDAKNAMYVLQVFNADTRRLLASATSITPSMLEVTDLPVAERGNSGLVLLVRVMTPHATSEAAVLHSQQLTNDGSNPEHQIFPALSPVILSISGPLLSVVVGAAAGIFLVIFLIVLVVRLRCRPKPRNDKDSHDDGGMATLTSPNDKTTAMPLNSDSIESFEKNPDIIPHPSENPYGELCKDTSPRMMMQQTHPQPSMGAEFASISPINNYNSANGHWINNAKMQYSGLTLRCNRRVPPNCYQPIPLTAGGIVAGGLNRPSTQVLAMSTLPRRISNHPDNSIYGQLVAQHAGKPIYNIPPPQQYMTTARSSISSTPSHDDNATVETPLIGYDKIPTITGATNSWMADSSASTTNSTS